MPRQPRNFVAGIPLHLIQRGNNRQPCFFRQEDYAVYLSILIKYADRYCVALHSYVLMNNHVHLLVTPSDAEGVSKLWQSLGRSYVRYINKEHGRTGTLWDGRFKASPVDSDLYFLTVSRYIELNPVRAKMVEHPAEYRWSSYSCNALGRHSSILKPHRCYLTLGSSPGTRQQAYRLLFHDRISEKSLKKLRKAVNKGWALGDDKFKKKIEQQLGRAIPPFPRGGDRRSAQFNSRAADKIKRLRPF